MSDRERYRAFAEQCLAISKESNDLRVKKKILSIAQVWLDLAEDIETQEALATRH